jgi:Kef-type K+ transport system membrane component KefB
MKKYANSVYYVAVIGFFSVLIYLISENGRSLETGRNILSHSADINYWNQIVSSFESNVSHPLTILLFQILVILLITRLFGWICKKLRQPVVIGEIIAGILLGPSLLGYYFPGFSAALFPVQSLGNLHILSQIGLILFMFMVGMELDFNSLRNKVTKALIISHTGIIFSFTLGMGLAYFLYSLLSPEGIPFLSFALFLGISVSITAFPVLARIMQERGIHKTELGIFVITCAAIDDITAWSLLAVVVAIVKAGSFISAVPTIFLSVCYVFLMLMVVRPFLRRVGELHPSRENLTKPVVAIFFIVLMLSALTTEFIGIHAIFGGFMAGAIMPDNVKFRNVFIEKVEDVALVLFLPLFFVYTGLRTQIGLLNNPELWKICLAVILVAISGKLIGGTLSSRFTGQSWKDSITIGSLMNSRGLVELVVLNIGFDLGVFSPEIFAMLVIMALLTTFMTAPMLDVIGRLFRRKEKLLEQEPVYAENFNLLLSFANPERGKSMMKLANSFVRQIPGKGTVTALHLSPLDDMFHPNLDEYEEESFSPLVKESQELNQPVQTLFKISGNIESDIAELANKGDFNILIIGVGHSIFEGSMLGRMLGFTARIINPSKLFYKISGKENQWYKSGFDDRIRSILSKTTIPVGIFIDNNLSEVRKIFVPLSGVQDAFVIRYARMLIANSGSTATVYDPMGISRRDAKTKAEISTVNNHSEDSFEIIEEGDVSEVFIKTFDLVLVSIAHWASLVENPQKWLYHIPSALIVTK